MKNCNEIVESVSGIRVKIADYDLYEDYKNRKSYKAINLQTGRKCRVKINHFLTGTNTTGTGDTIVNIIN